MVEGVVEGKRVIDRREEAVNMLVGTMTSEQWMALIVIRNVKSYPYTLEDKRILISSLIKED